NVRAFGEDPADVALMGAAYVTGVQDHGAIATGKHFPGHGDTDTDSHLALPVIRHDRARMDAVELRPFQAAIDAGMGAIMTAHISVPTLTGGNPDPATLSPYVLTTILRHQMGFDGLVFTDAMDMSAIARGRTAAEAAVRAVEAGADVILMPASVPAAINGIVTAVERGRIPEERIDRSVRRLLAMKVSLGLDTLRAVPIDGLKEVVGIPAHNALAEEIAQRSMTVLKNDRGLLPLLGTRNARVLSVTYRRSSDILAGRYFNQHLRSVYPRLSTFELDGDANGDRYDELRDRVRDNVLVVVGTYVTAVSYQGSVAVPDDLVEFIQYLDEIDVPHVVVSFGNPYLISDFPDVQAYMLGWSGSRVSQRAAAGALLGEFEVGGRTPTRIPPGYEIGAGMRRPARARPRGHSPVLTGGSAWRAGGSRSTRSLGLRLALAALLTCQVACGGAAPGAMPADGPPAPSRTGGVPPTLSSALDEEGRAWVERTLAGMTLETLAAQLVVEWIPGGYAAPTSPAFDPLRSWVADHGIGGVSPSIGSPLAYAAKLNELQRLAPVPLLVASDFENGGPGMRLSGSYALPSMLPQGSGTAFPPTMAFGAIGEERFGYEYGRITAREARATGVHMLLAPVLDVNSNPDNPVISTRSFGADPELVARLGAAFIRGARDGGALTTGKHFPGHGDTSVDSHLGIPVIEADRARLDTLELVPFERASSEE